MRPTTDTYKHKGLRQKLLKEIESKGITDTTVLGAINAIPRHFFLDSALEHIAYEDRAFPISEGQTISQPYTVAYQTQLLQLQPQMKVLEIGTGSAYQAVVLASLKTKVYTIERQKILFDLNKDFAYLKQFLALKMFYGDGFEGLPTYAPFDRVLITAAAPIIPPKLLAQLKVNGQMVIPLNNGTAQTMQRITKIDNSNNYTTEVFENFSFVPMLTGKAK
jgi:protein-L-isoaspartate(D-aspartate) O-methyltransferase